MKLPHAAWVVVADGEKHLLLENHGDEDLIDLRVRSADESSSFDPEEDSIERPGRYPGPAARREAVEETDRRRLNKERYSADLAEALSASAARDEYRTLVLVSDPRTLGALRQHLSGAAQARVVKEISGDYAHQTIEAIETLVKSA